MLAALHYLLAVFTFPLTFKFETTAPSCHAAGEIRAGTPRRHGDKFYSLKNIWKCSDFIKVNAGASGICADFKDLPADVCRYRNCDR